MFSSVLTDLERCGAVDLPEVAGFYPVGTTPSAGKFKEQEHRTRNVPHLGGAKSLGLLARSGVQHLWRHIG